MNATKLLIAGLALGLALPAVALALDAGDSILDPCQMQWVRDHRDGPGLIASGYPQYYPVLGVQWVAVPPPEWTSGLWEIQIGDAYDTPIAGSGMLGCYLCPYLNTMVNWSNFSTYSLRISNNSPLFWFEAGLAINTGATGLGEPNSYYETPWVVLGPGASQVLTMDLTACINLDHVSNISFRLRSDSPQIDATVIGGEQPTAALPATWGAIKALYGN